MNKKLIFTTLTCTLSMGLVACKGTPAPTLESIKVTAPTKVDYYVGDTFEPAGMAVKAIYSDESVVTVPSTDYTYETPDMSTAGDKTVTVTYQQKTDSFTIHVIEHQHYSITWLNYDDSELRVDSVIENTVPSYGSNPTRESDGYYTYEFAGWTPEIVAATANATYKATFNAIPITEIDKNTFNKAKDFYGKNFTLVINSAAGYEETFTHNEKNEYYGVYSTDSATNYRAFKNQYGDSMIYFTGEVSGEKIVWADQISGTASELHNYAFDQNKSIQDIMSFNFEDLNYDSEAKHYTSSKGDENWTFSFAGARLLSASKSFYNVVTTFTFSDYDDTEVKYDQYLTDYIINMYPTRETLKSIIQAALVDKYLHDQDDMNNGDLEFELTYYENNENKEHYQIHMEQVLTQFIYDGENKICGKKNGSYLFVPVLCAEYVLEDDGYYRYTMDYHTNPFNDGTFGTRSRKAIDIVKEALEDIEAWTNYTVESGRADFDFNSRHYTFEISFNTGEDLAWYINRFDVQFNDGEKDIEYNADYINIEFEYYDEDDIKIDEDDW